MDVERRHPGHLATTLIEAMAAFAIGIVAGVIAGVALARIELLAAVFDPYIRVMNALPRVILAPILIIWFGLGMASKIALGVSRGVLHRLLQHLPGPTRG